MLIIVMKLFSYESREKFKIVLVYFFILVFYFSSISIKRLLGPTDSPWLKNYTN